jgi:hypothetical protein
MRRRHWSLPAVHDSSWRLKIDRPRDVTGRGKRIHGGGRRLFSRPQALGATRSTLSSLVPDLAVLGRQHDCRPRQRRTHSAVDALLHPLGRRVSYPAAVRRAPSRPRLADDPQACRHAGAARLLRLLLLQRDHLLRPAIYDRDQRPVDAVERSVVRGAVELFVARRAPDAAPGRRHLRLADRRPGHHQPG